MGGASAGPLLRLFFPLPPGYETDGPSAAEIKTALGPRMRAANVAAFAAGTLAAAVLIALLFAYAAAVRRAFPAGALVLAPDPLALLIPAGFLFLVALMVAYAVVPARMLGADAPLYVRYSSLQGGFRADRANVLIPALFVPLVVIGSLGLATAYTVFAPDGIRHRPAFALSGARYAYSDVASILTAPATVAPNGNTVPGRVWVVRFKDGGRWSSADVLSELADAEKSRIAQLVVARSGIAPLEKGVLKQGEF